MIAPSADDWRTSASAVATPAPAINVPIGAAKPVAGSVPAGVQGFSTSVHALDGAPSLRALAPRGEEKPRGAREAALFRQWSPGVVLVAVSDGLAGQVVETIQAAASTDAIGDGKIFVLDLAQAIRIRTGETGDTAL